MESNLLSSSYLVKVSPESDWDYRFLLPVEKLADYHEYLRLDRMKDTDAFSVDYNGERVKVLTQCEGFYCEPVLESIDKLGECPINSDLEDINHPLLFERPNRLNQLIKAISKIKTSPGLENITNNEFCDIMSYLINFISIFYDDDSIPVIVRYPSTDIAFIDYFGFGFNIDYPTGFTDIEHVYDVPDDYREHLVVDNEIPFIDITKLSEQQQTVLNILLNH